MPIIQVVVHIYVHCMVHLGSINKNAVGLVGTLDKCLGEVLTQHQLGKVSISIGLYAMSRKVVNMH